MAVERVEHVIKRASMVVTAQRADAHERRRWLPCVRRALRLPLMGLVFVVAVGCSSNKTQTISESYVQSVVNLNNGLALHVGDVSRLTSATSALQQADSLIRQAAERRNEALKNFAEINADFDATREELNAIVNANQSANNSDLETLIELITTFQSSLTSEELIKLYPERAEFAEQTLMLLEGN
jgi:multidrug efflux pump subunit AcrA (membrane-fusion protein)